MYLRVGNADQRSVWVLERGRGGRGLFRSGSLQLNGPPNQHLPGPHELGALPMAGSVFRFWPTKGRRGLGRGAIHDAASVEIPVQGGPWRGLVAQLKYPHRYPAVVFTPLPGQPPTYDLATVKLTELLLCFAPNILACIPWRKAVDAGWVRCERPDRRIKVSKATCRRSAPFTEWTVKDAIRPPRTP